MIESAKKIFVTGIGGIGVSGLARIFASRGIEVSGSDVQDSELLHRLAEEGIRVYDTQSAGNLSAGTDLLIYSNAVPENSPDRAAAREQGVPELSYPQALGELLRDYFLIAVTGTNGKTTTAAMTAAVLEQAGLDPTVLVGSIMKNGSNVRMGKSLPAGGRANIFVLEADEYRRGFLNYSPDIVVITNIEADHLDYFRDEQDVKAAFSEFAEKIKPDGLLIYNQENKNAADVAGRFKGRKLGFETEQFELHVPGRVQQANASAAATVGRELGVKQDDIKSALENFKGTWRRFELVGKFAGADIISDYAHHPAGVNALLEAAALKYDPDKTLVVYQPHQHNRTKTLFDNFVKSFCQGKIDNLIFVEIFDVAGREQDHDQDISSKDLAREVAKCKDNVTYAAGLDQAEEMIRKAADKADKYEAIFIVGAGDIYLIAEGIVK